MRGVWRRSNRSAGRGGDGWKIKCRNMRSRIAAAGVGEEVEAGEKEQRYGKTCKKGRREGHETRLTAVLKCRPPTQGKAADRGTQAIEAARSYKGVR